jgi:hypothetical protein
LADGNLKRLQLKARFFLKALASIEWCHVVEML